MEILTLEESQSTENINNSSTERKGCNTIKETINIHKICIAYKCFSMLREVMKVMISMDPSILLISFHSP